MSLEAQIYFNYFFQYLLRLKFFLSCRGLAECNPLNSYNGFFKRWRKHVVTHQEANIQGWHQITNLRNSTLLHISLNPDILIALYVFFLLLEEISPGCYAIFPCIVFALE